MRRKELRIQWCAPQSGREIPVADDPGDPRRARAHPRFDLSFSVRALRDVFPAHRKLDLLQARKPADDGRVQGARRAEQNSAAHRGRAAPRRDRGVGGQPRAGRRLSRDQARHRSRNLHAADDADHQSIRHARLWRGSGPGRRELRRGLPGSPAPLPASAVSLSSIPSTTKP